MVNTESVAQQVLSLPIYPELTSEQIEQIGEAIVSWGLAQRT